MGERWFSDEEPGEMSRPTMERAIEAIQRGDADEAKRLCESMKHEAQAHLHDEPVRVRPAPVANGPLPERGWGVTDGVP
jgi:hypothetical protein